MCCPELQFAKMLSGTAICKNVLWDETSQKCCPEPKNANFMKTYDP